jgi:predicted RNA-binding Zn ribbon-like protein
VDALELANSLAVVRGRPVDTLEPSLGLHELRDAVRGLFDAAVRGVDPPAGAVGLVNALAAAPSLDWGRRGPRLADEPVAAAVARSAIELVTGGRLEACANPRCVQYHLGDGGRAYCSAGCANRARVARHEARAR